MSSLSAESNQPVGEKQTMPAATAGTAPRATWRTFALLATALVVAVATMVVRTKWPALTPEEARRVGTWYGYIHDGDRHYCWITQLRRDRTCQIGFRNFEDPEIDIATVVGQELWLASYINHVHGTWRVDGTTYSTVTSDSVQHLGLMTRLWLSLIDRWPYGGGETRYSYTIARETPDEFVYTLDSEGVTFHAVRVPADFQFPEEPVPTSEARAWWAQRQANAPQ